MMLGLGMGLVRAAKGFVSFINTFFRYTDGEGDSYADESGNNYKDRG